MVPGLYTTLPYPRVYMVGIHLPICLPTVPPWVYLPWYTLPCTTGYTVTRVRGAERQSPGLYPEINSGFKPVGPTLLAKSVKSVILVSRRLFRFRGRINVKDWIDEG